MAQETIVKLIDDIDGTQADESVQFGLDGVSWTIDLSTEHAAALRNALSTFVERGRKVSAASNGTKPKAKSNGTSDVDLPTVRAWALAQGIPVSARGRVAGDVIKQFADAHI